MGGAAGGRRDAARIGADGRERALREARVGQGSGHSRGHQGRKPGVEAAKGVTWRNDRAGVRPEARPRSRSWQGHRLA